MRIRFLRLSKGGSLIEVVCAILILSFAMGGVYMGLMTAAKDLMSHEQTFEAMNIVHFYQQKIDNLDLNECSSVDLDLLESQICKKDFTSKTLILPIKTPFKENDGKSLVLEFNIIEQSPKRVQIDYHLMQNNQTLLKSRQWKVL